MNKGKLSALVVAVCICLAGYAGGQVRIAVLSDVHVQDTSRVRTMQSQLHSTRLFNENYFAFISALDDVVRRGIHYVILTGDLTDNGQPANVRLVDKVLSQYAAKYHVRYFIMTGNHDPARPLQSPAGGDMQSWERMWGYPEVHAVWGRYGFMPQRAYLYWATPFSTYSYKDYTYAKAQRASSWAGRTWRYQGLKPDIHDGSYVVEPIPGVWLLGIDASVYPPVRTEGDSIVEFRYPSSGYNDVLQQKPYLLPWITRVSADAHRYGKRLIAFSHYPMVDYNSGATEYLNAIASKKRNVTSRFPLPSVSEQLADAGITLHFGGHIHLNDDTTFVSSDGHRLRNIQTPSTAGYMPAYKILTLRVGDISDVETVTLDSIRGFDTFFPRYRAEYDSLKRCGGELWNDSILLSKNYREYCAWHLRLLTRLRYIPSELDSRDAEKLVAMTASELYSRYGIQSADTMQWTGFDFVADIYKLYFGYWLAYSDIPSSRFRQYRQLADAVIMQHPSGDFDEFVYALCRTFKSKSARY